MYATGGGVEAVPMLLSVPGGSRSVMDVQVPYATLALKHALDNNLASCDSYCSEKIATIMAMKARDRARELHLQESRNVSEVTTGAHIFGIGCSASLVSATPKRGLHQAHICMASSDAVYNIHVNLDKRVPTGSAQVRSRREEDALVAQLILEAVAVGAAGGNVSLFERPEESPGTEITLQGHISASLDAAEKASGGLCLFTEFRASTEADADADVIARKLRGIGGLDEILSGVVRREIGSALCVPNAPTISVEEGTFRAVADLSPLPLHSFVYPGSFNPLHAGHVRLVDAALQFYRDFYVEHFLADYAESFNSGLGCIDPANKPVSESSGSQGGVRAPAVPVLFEISAVNADKPPLEIPTIHERLRQFAPLCDQGTAHSATDTDLDNFNPAALVDSPEFEFLHANSKRLQSVNGNGRNVAVCVTSEPFFVDKAKLFPGCIFVVGVDTLDRMFNPKYYGGSVVEMMIALYNITQVQRCRFIVGGRVVTVPSDSDSDSDSEHVRQSFKTMDDVFDSIEKGLQQPIPLSVRGRFHGLSEAYFRLDLSSSEIRSKMKK